MLRRLFYNQKIRRYIFQFTTHDKTMKLRERQRGGGRKGEREKEKDWS